jgi:hypothetical protein
MKTSLLSVGFFTLLLLTQSASWIPLTATEIELPQDEQVEKFVKSKLPPYLKFSTLDLKSHQITGKALIYNGKITATVQEHLYKDVTSEVPEIANAPKTSIEPPMILKKLHGAGEIVEIPIEVQYKNSHDEWQASGMEDYQLIEQFGKPQNDFKFGAVVFGSSDAKRMITQYLKDVQSAPKTKSNSKSSTKKEANSSEPSSEKTATSTTDTSVSAAPETDTLKEKADKVQQSEKDAFKELEKKFYAGEKPSDTHLKQTEASVEKLIKSKSTKDDDFKTFQQKYKDDIQALAENYTQAGHDASFERDTTNFRVKSMCEDYAEAYKDFAKGDFGQARIVMDRARKKRDEIKDLLVK